MFTRCPDPDPILPGFVILTTCLLLLKSRDPSIGSSDTILEAKSVAKARRERAKCKGKG